MRAYHVLPAMLLAACNLSPEARAGEGGGSDRSYALSGFSGVALAGRHNVIVSHGPQHSVRATGDEAVLDRLEIRVENNRLTIGERRQGSWMRLGRQPAATIHVTMPAIETAAIAGSGDMRIDRTEGRRFSASIAGSGDMHVAEMRVEEASFSIAGSGDIRAAGMAANAKVSIAGSGDMDLSGLESRTAEISIMGSGDAKLRAMESATVTVMGSGDVAVSGPARCTVTKRGSGNVRCNV